MPLNYAQLEQKQGQFAAQYAAWQAELAARSEELKGLLADAASNPDLLRQAIEEAEQQLTNLYLDKTDQRADPDPPPTASSTRTLHPDCGRWLADCSQPSSRSAVRRGQRRLDQGAHRQRGSA